MNVPLFYQKHGLDKDDIKQLETETNEFIVGS